MRLVILLSIFIFSFPLEVIGEREKIDHDLNLIIDDMVFYSEKIDRIISGELDQEIINKVSLKYDKFSSYLVDIDIEYYRNSVESPCDVFILNVRSKEISKRINDFYFCVTDSCSKVKKNSVISAMKNLRSLILEEINSCRK